ncbi:MAG: cupredoxin domain-containing protein [bacterium]|nr:cupredoxin domain-containing protein [bacterium]
MKKQFIWLVVGLVVIVIGVIALTFVPASEPAPATPSVEVTATPISPSPEPALAPEPAPAPAPALEPTPAPEPIPAPAPQAAVTVKEFTVTGQNYSFSPSTLVVKKGDTVKITFKNVNGMHDFRIDEFRVATQKIQGGAEETVQFVADKVGAFQYYCSVGQHRANGMWGTLTVTE